MKDILSLVVYICCFLSIQAQTFKVGYEVYRPNGDSYIDSVEVYGDGSTILASPMIYYEANVDTANYIFLQPDDSLMMYLYYPMQATRYYSIELSTLYTSTDQNDIYTQGPEVLREHFSDTLNGTDTLVYHFYGQLANFFVKIAFTENASVDKNSKDLGMMVYPNPSSGYFTVQFPEGTFGNVLFILNSTGKIVFQKAIQNNTTNQLIDVSNLPSGMYFLQYDNFRNKIVIRH